MTHRDCVALEAPGGAVCLWEDGSGVHTEGKEGKHGLGWAQRPLSEPWPRRLQGSVVSGLSEKEAFLPIMPQNGAQVGAGGARRALEDGSRSTCPDPVPLRPPAGGRGREPRAGADPEQRLVLKPQPSESGADECPFYGRKNGPREAGWSGATASGGGWGWERGGLCTEMCSEDGEEPRGVCTPHTGGGPGAEASACPQAPPGLGLAPQGARAWLPVAVVRWPVCWGAPRSSWSSFPGRPWRPGRLLMAL